MSVDRRYVRQLVAECATREFLPGTDYETWHAERLKGFERIIEKRRAAGEDAEQAEQIIGEIRDRTPYAEELMRAIWEEVRVRIQ